MHPKQLRYAVSLAAVSLLTGCAAAPQSQGTPVPQALLEAAQQASHARMVYADLQARLHGTSIEEVRLDEPDAGVPDFMRARVRLDYNGPMLEVMERVANDIGYRVNEYSKPSAGVGWSPWMRARGDKPLIDHVREMNTQVPWHIVLDHRNRRLIIDYSAEGGMATQVREAREADERQREQNAQRTTMPNTTAIEQASRVGMQESLGNQPAQAPREASAANPGRYASATTQANPSRQSEWRVDIEGYQSEAQANAMVEWLKEDNLSATIIPRGATYDVRVLANNNDDARSIHAHLSSFNIPGVVGQVESGRRGAGATSTAAPQHASPSRATSSTTDSRSWQTPAINTNQSNRQVAESAILTREQEQLMSGHYRIQAAYGSNLEDFGRHIKALSDQGVTAHLSRAGSNGFNLRIGPFETRNEMQRVLRDLRRTKFSDAYALSPRQ